MNIRLFSNDSTYVQKQPLSTLPSKNGNFIIPLDKDQTDLSSIYLDNLSGNLYIATNQDGYVIKQNDRFTGNIHEYTDERVTLQMPGSRLIIRNYDQIYDPTYIMAKLSSKIVPSSIIATYLTRGINGTIRHNLDVGAQILHSDLIITNNTDNDLVNTTVEIVVAEQPNMLYRAVSDSSVQDTSIGSIYRVDKRNTIPAGYETTIPIIQTQVKLSEVYIIDAPNGLSNSIYTLQWNPPLDIPGGDLYVYDNDSLQARTYISSVGKDQTVSTPIVSVPNVYARGTIQVNTIDENSSMVKLSGVIYNNQPKESSIILRYNVGDSAISVQGNNAIRVGEYLYLRYVLKPSSTQVYDISFNRKG